MEIQQIIGNELDENIAIATSIHMIGTTHANSRQVLNAMACNVYTA